MFLVNPFERFLYAPDAEAGAGEIDDEVDDIRGETEPSDDDAPADEAETSPNGEAAADPEGDDDDEAAPAATAAPTAFEHGIEGVPTTAEELREWHAQQQQQIRELRQREEYARNQALYLLHQQQQAQAAQQQAAQQQQPKQPEAWKNPLGELPEYRPEWQQLIRLNEETGHYEAIPGAQLDLPQRIAAYRYAREEAIDKLLRDPGSVLKSWAEHNGYVTREQAQEMHRQTAEYAAEQMYLLQETERNRAWAINENNQLTPAGESWNQYYQFLRQKGVSFREAGAMATKALEGDAFVQSLQQPAQPGKAAAKPATVQDKRREVQKATNPPSRSGTLPKSAGRNRLNGSTNLKQALKSGYSNLSDNDFLD